MDTMTRKVKIQISATGPGLRPHAYEIETNPIPDGVALDIFARSCLAVQDVFKIKSTTVTKEGVRHGS